MKQKKHKMKSKIEIALEIAMKAHKGQRVLDVKPVSADYCAQRQQ